MRVLVTGGAGFIGSHLVEELLRRGFVVRILDNLTTGSLLNLSGLSSTGNWEFIRGSTLDRAAVSRSLRNCDAVFHLAAIVGVRKLMASPERTYRENLQGAKIVFEEGMECGIPILFISSSEVYGDGRGRLLREEEAVLGRLPNRARFLYGRSKLQAEHELYQLNRRTRGSSRVVRLFNVIGSRQTSRYGMVVPTFIGQAWRGVPITVFGDGDQSRCFADVGEVVSCLARLLPQKPGFDVLNLGSQESIKIRDLARIIQTLAESRSRIVKIPLSNIYGPQFEDFRSRVPDLSCLKSMGLELPCRPVGDVVRKILENEKAKQNRIPVFSPVP